MGNIPRYLKDTIMENINEWLVRNQHQSLDAIVDSLIAMKFSRLEISNAIKNYIDNKKPIYQYHGN